MHHGLLSVGCLLALLAAALPGAGHHIVEDPVHDQDGQDPQEWSNPVAVGPEATNLLRAGQPQCEALRQAYGLLAQNLGLPALGDCPELRRNPYAGIVRAATCERMADPPLPGSSGIGGLCFMAPGFAGNPCTFVGPAVNQGNSNGFQDSYSGGPCATSFTAMPLERHWYRITMWVEKPVPYQVPFVAVIGGHTCHEASMEVVFDGVYTDVVGGHVEGYPTAATPAGTYGSYKVDKYAGTPAAPALESCGAFPMYI